MSRLSRAVLVTVATLAALAVVGCGGEGEEEQAADNGNAAPEADLTRYCQLAQELDQAGSDIFRELEQDPNATPEDFQASEGELVEQNEETIDEAVEVAPPEISQEMGTLVEGLRVRAGLSDAQVDPQEVAQADKTVEEFERQNCPSG